MEAKACKRKTPVKKDVKENFIDKNWHQIHLTKKVVNITIKIISSRVNAKDIKFLGLEPIPETEEKERKALMVENCAKKDK